MQQKLLFAVFNSVSSEHVNLFFHQTSSEQKDDTQNCLPYTVPQSLHVENGSSIHRDAQSLNSFPAETDCWRWSCWQSSFRSQSSRESSAQEPWTGLDYEGDHEWIWQLCHWPDVDHAAEWQSRAPNLKKQQCNILPSFYGHYIGQPAAYLH